MDEELKKQITWFESYQVTFNSVKLSESEDIFDLERYIDSYLRSIKKNYANPTFFSRCYSAQEVEGEVRVNVVFIQYYY